MSARAVTLVLWSALAVIAPTDVVRLRVPAVERVYERLLGFLMRESERVRVPPLPASSSSASVGLIFVVLLL
jgi:hypothetical protein